ncbi:leucine carboxyl methyltransferase [Elsinoe australis]|uniref:Leucine carboxyl methyltransferase 1 n=1 Tax=Elsinoe australis TaxID=40998 RepID=A0A4U7B7H3_9PEZI|nr:leucine carboxyl methyltransferase [Elsinoe australis]
MSASSIPNLATLRGRGGPRGRGRGRGTAPGGITNKTEGDQAKTKDGIVQQTDNDAASSRASAVSLGYLQDPYAFAFASIPPPRRYPLINRGTYVRSIAIDRLVKSFLDTDNGSRKQIISLGAGSDTRFFRFSGVPNLIYHEFDFASNTTTKVNRTLENYPMRAALQSANTASTDVRVAPTKDALYSKSLNIHPLDLREIYTTSAAQAKLENLDPDAPTLILSECCLTYLTRDDGTKILNHILRQMLHPSTPAAVVFYEPIKPKDAFGQTMTSNLGSRGIEMPALHEIPTLEAHRQRIKQLGLPRTGARTVYDIYTGQPGPIAEQTPLHNAHDSSPTQPPPTITASDPDSEAEGSTTPRPSFSNASADTTTLSSSSDDKASQQEKSPSKMWITPQERERVERLEWLDEVEEWKLLASHYCVAWGWRDGSVDQMSEEGDGGGGGTKDEVFSRAWGDIAGWWREEERRDDELHGVASPGGGGDMESQFGAGGRGPALESGSRTQEGVAGLNMRTRTFTSGVPTREQLVRGQYGRRDVDGG